MIDKDKTSIEVISWLPRVSRKSDIVLEFIRINKNEIPARLVRVTAPMTMIIVCIKS
jgi:hypothetical protein